MIGVRGAEKENRETVTMLREGDEEGRGRVIKEGGGRVIKEGGGKAMKDPTENTYLFRYIFLNIKS